jgi:DNA-binding IclR family transcriptional regulator
VNDNNRSAAGHPAKNVKVKRPGERRSLSRSATRALDVLELFGEVRRPLRAIEMSKALGLHASSINQLLKTMVESAHLTFDAHLKTYLPSPRLAHFSAWMLASYGGDEQFRDLLHKLNVASAEVVTLTTPNDLYMQILDVVGAEPTTEATERGLRVSIFGSATGAAYLSTLPRMEVDRLVVRARIREGDIPAILAHAARVRAAGLAEGPSVGGQYWSIAMPLPAGFSPAPLIVGLAGPAERIKQNLARLQAVVRATVDGWLAARGVTDQARALRR